jgi:hypothetical protein
MVEMNGRKAIVRNGACLDVPDNSRSAGWGALDSLP